MSELASEVLDRGAISHQEAMDYFAEFGYTGYQVGKIIEATGQVVIAQEIDFSMDEEDQDPETIWPQGMFPGGLELKPGDRYSIAHETYDHGTARDLWHLRRADRLHRGAVREPQARARARAAPRRRRRLRG